MRQLLSVPLVTPNVNKRSLVSVGPCELHLSSVAAALFPDVLASCLDFSLTDISTLSNWQQHSERLRLCQLSWPLAL